MQGERAEDPQARRQPDERDAVEDCDLPAVVLDRLDAVRALLADMHESGLGHVCTGVCERPAANQRLGGIVGRRQH
ncbi:MAG TPA: hypothetical protein VFK71_01795 [Gaiellaceae bacterium]|nr:hypothetical protein [Gaiellaceae bacterium]